jgi:hypothetical protein
VCVCGVAFVLFVFCYFCLCTRVFCFLNMYWFQPILTGPEGKCVCVCVVVLLLFCSCFVIFVCAHECFVCCTCIGSSPFSLGRKKDIQYQIYSIIEQNSIMEERKMYRTKENLHQNFPSGKWDEEIGKTEVDPYSPLWRAEGRQSKVTLDKRKSSCSIQFTHTCFCPCTGRDLCCIIMMSSPFSLGRKEIYSTLIIRRRTILSSVVHVF